MTHLLTHVVTHLRTLPPASPGPGTSDSADKIIELSTTLNTNAFAMLRLVAILFVAALLFRLLMALINSWPAVIERPVPQPPQAPYLAASTTPQTWDDTLARHDGVLADWRRHREEDLQLKLTHLLLQDLTDPAVAAAATALATADHHRATRPPTPGPDITTTAYWLAVQDADAKVASAIAKAKRVGTSTLPAEEAERIAEAQSLLARALDAGNYPAERQLAYQRVARLIAGIVDNPTPALAALATSTGLQALTTTPTPTAAAATATSRPR